MFIKRLFDIFSSLILGFLLLVPLFFLGLAVKITSPGPIFYWSNRVGRNSQSFEMPKLRSMSINTPTVASHLLENHLEYLTPIGSFLRKSSLDELPQLWSIFKGDMSLVGPRPALFNQRDLIQLRIERGVDKLPPGLTGWAQVNGRDELTVGEKVRLDEEYLNKRSLIFDFKIMWITFLRVLYRDGISH